jgi:hypothetical protein
MKRSDRKNVKTESGQSHANPHQNERDNHERHIEGSIHVRGEIEAQRPPNLTQEHNAERKEDNAREKKKYVVEVITLILIAIYALITFFQACLTKRGIDNNAAQFLAENRPWLECTPESDVDYLNYFRVLVRVQNTGKTPATHVTDIDARVRAFTQKEMDDGTWDKWEKEEIPPRKNPTDIISVGSYKTATATEDAPYIPFAGVYPRIIVYGRVDYSGAYVQTERYWTEFCFAYTPPAKTPRSIPWSNCVAHAEMH